MNVTVVLPSLVSIWKYCIVSITCETEHDVVKEQAPHIWRQQSSTQTPASKVRSQSLKVDINISSQTSNCISSFQQKG
ncbi:hypothetical protein ATANTOWER_025303 [Ataeniobius toweri]|uniref:Uncharacterized protein n=1 Tax=Ataeniobius toweri TaxID=208326 RepID=A0ABU7BCS3_9TELE|nr:hypothetical protein [Ataeniobius toweri]